MNPDGTQIGAIHVDGTVGGGRTPGAPSALGGGYFVSGGTGAFFGVSGYFSDAQGANANPPTLGERQTSACEDPSLRMGAGNATEYFILVPLTRPDRKPAFSPARAENASTRPGRGVTSSAAAAPTLDPGVIPHSSIKDAISYAGLCKPTARIRWQDAACASFERTQSRLTTGVDRSCETGSTLESGSESGLSG